MKKNSFFLFGILFIVILFVVSCTSSNGNNGGNAPQGNTGNNGSGSNVGTPGVPPSLSGSCTVFPADNPWNLDISNAPLDLNSANYIAGIGSSTNLHPDFGSNPDYGIPYTIVTGSQPKVPMTFDAPDESDPGPYPIPPNAPVEAGSDAHILVIDQDNCLLYEIGNAVYLNPGWQAFSGALFDLKSNALRPDGWTSADAAGLPIFPGLVRYDEAVIQKEIRHALRFTVSTTQKGFIHPATHYASSNTSPNVPPMGLRVRLKASYDISGFTGASLVILTALKKYGMFVADNGGNWFISGSTDNRWDDNDLEQLKTVPGSAFEVVQTGAILHVPPP